MTDPVMADATYIEPLNIEGVPLRGWKLRCLIRLFRFPAYPPFKFSFELSKSSQIIHKNSKIVV